VVPDGNAVALRSAPLLGSMHVHPELDPGPIQLRLKRELHELPFVIPE
jgi:hypothetical protein